MYFTNGCGAVALIVAVPVSVRPLIRYAVTELAAEPPQMSGTSSLRSPYATALDPDLLASLRSRSHQAVVWGLINHGPEWIRCDVCKHLDHP